MQTRHSPETMPALVYETGPVRWAGCKAAGWVWPGVFWSRWAPLQLRTVPVPDLPSPRWVRLRPVLGGICGTDVAAIGQRQHPASILQTISSFPAVLGHENISVVDEVGSDVTGWQAGDRVVVEPALSCEPREIDPVCESCAAGRFTLCRHFRRGPLPVGSMIGWNCFTGGSWAPYFVAHMSQLHRVPEGVDDAHALLTDPIAGALHAVLKRKPDHNETVLVVGGGLLGLGVAACIRALGLRCRVLSVVRHERQGELMRRFGADELIMTSGKDSQAARYRAVVERVGGEVVPSMFGHQALFGGVDLVYDCVGTGQSLTDAMKYARPGGTVVEVGTTQICLVDTAPLWLDELTLLGSNGRAMESYQGRRMHTYEVVLEMIRDGQLDLSGLVTHRFALRDYRQAFETLRHRTRAGAIKVAFEPAKDLG